VLHAIDIGIQSAGDYSSGMFIINRIYECNERTERRRRRSGKSSGHGGATVE